MGFDAAWRSPESHSTLKLEPLNQGKESGKGEREA